MPMRISPSIFKAYDIRGIVDDTLTVDAVRAIGLALGAKARAAGMRETVIGRDGRLSGPALSTALAEGFRDAGIDVIDIGMVPTPVVYYATFELGTGTGVARHRKPQSGRLQRPEDGHRERRDLRRSDPGLGARSPLVPRRGCGAARGRCARKLLVHTGPLAGDVNRRSMRSGRWRKG